MASQFEYSITIVRFEKEDCMQEMKAPSLGRAGLQCSEMLYCMYYVNIYHWNNEPLKDKFSILVSMMWQVSSRLDLTMRVHSDH
uniref:SFRICE_025250 n=1 Tax=Spodoptera frugiperda TaxID=7108 RepID=A0A2H1VDM7_SPOFR